MKKIHHSTKKRKQKNSKNTKNSKNSRKNIKTPKKKNNKNMNGGGNLNFCNYNLDAKTKTNKVHVIENFNEKPKNITYAEKGRGFLEAVIDHQINRFNELDFILQNNSKISVIIAGDTTTNTHNLGTNLAIEQWDQLHNIDITKVKVNGFTMNAHLNNLIKKLQKKYPKRIYLGAIGIAGKKTKNSDINYCNEIKANNPSKNIIHVWGANEQNWNLNTGITIPGHGQVDCLDKQMPGVFGIATTYHSKKINERLFEDTSDKIRDYLH